MSIRACTRLSAVQSRSKRRSSGTPRRTYRDRGREGSGADGRPRLGAYKREWDGLLRTIEHERVPADQLPADLGHHANNAAVEAPAEAATAEPAEAAAVAGEEAAPAAPAAATKPIEDQLRDIAADVSANLQRARPRAVPERVWRVIADLEGAAQAARARLRASLFPDLGTPEEIYQREGAEILRAGQQSVTRVRAPAQRTDMLFQAGYLDRIKSALRDLISFTRTGPRNQTRTVEVGRVSDAAADIIRQDVGIDVSRYMHTVDAFALRHVINKHTEEVSELKRG